MISRELSLLIESIKLTMLDGSVPDFREKVNDPKINWDKILKMVHYHHIKPVFYRACKLAGFNNQHIERIAYFSQTQAIKNLTEKVESIRILKLLEKNEIHAVPYKGLLFLEKLYNNEAIRQIGDLDILVKPTEAFNALKVLMDDGYELKIEGTLTDDLLKSIIETKPSPEISLLKKNILETNFSIDFHWGMNESPYFKIDANSIFECCEMAEFNNAKLSIPNEIGIFKMLLNHHGSRECWVKLKLLVDLIAFKKAYPKLKNDLLQGISKEMNMLKIYTAGESLIELFFKKETKETINYPDAIALKRIVEMWETSKHWVYILPKIWLLRIYRLLQDKKTSWWKLIKTEAEFHAKIDLSVAKRIFILPPKYIFLNTLSKFYSYAIRTYLKPMFSK
jgi:hypothetical protein